MTPTESIASARKMFFQYKHAIWGRYGFVDSFSIADNTRADNTLGLDNGPIVLAIENYRTGLIWKHIYKKSVCGGRPNKSGICGDWGRATGFFPFREKREPCGFCHGRKPRHGLGIFCGRQSVVGGGFWAAHCYRPRAFDLGSDVRQTV
jgi:hypothetical protein